MPPSQKETPAAKPKGRSRKKKEAQKAAAPKTKKVQKEAAPKEKEAPPPAVPKPKAWQHSKARKMLRLDIEDGSITLLAYDAVTNKTGTKAEDAYKLRTEYQEYQFEKFEKYLETMRGIIRDHHGRASRDASAVAGFRQVYPKPPTNHRGEPRWEGSKAEEFLKNDMNEGKHTQMKPKQLRATRPEYQAYNPKTFSSHIDQEIRARKFQVYLKDKNDKNMKALKKGD